MNKAYSRFVSRNMMLNSRWKRIHFSKVRNDDIKEMEI